MNFTCGRNLRLTLFGESHGALVGVTADGLPAGIPVDESRMQAWLDLRRAYGDLSTARREEDVPRVVTGVFEGRTDGGPLTILIDNKAQRSGDYPNASSAPPTRTTPPARSWAVITTTAAAAAFRAA